MQILERTGDGITDGARVTLGYAWDLCAGAGCQSTVGIVRTSSSVMSRLPGRLRAGNTPIAA